MSGLSHTPTDRLAIGCRLGPIAGTGSAQTSASFDRMKYDSALLELLWSTSGGVTGGTIKIKVEQSATGSGSWTDFGTEKTVTIPAGPNAAGENIWAVDLRGAQQFVRVSVDSDPSGGSPASIVAAALLFSNPRTRPA